MAFLCFVCLALACLALVAVAAAALLLLRCLVRDLVEPEGDASAAHEAGAFQPPEPTLVYRHIWYRNGLKEVGVMPLAEYETARSLHGEPTVFQLGGRHVTFEGEMTGLLMEEEVRLRELVSAGLHIPTPPRWGFGVTTSGAGEDDAWDADAPIPFELS